MSGQESAASTAKGRKSRSILSRKKAESFSFRAPNTTEDKDRNCVTSSTLSVSVPYDSRDPRGSRSSTLPLDTDPSVMAAMSMPQSHSGGLLSKLKRKFRFGSKGKYDFKIYSDSSPLKPRRSRRKSEEPPEVRDRPSEQTRPDVKTQSVKTQRRSKTDKEEVILIRKDKRVSVICKPEYGEAEVIFSNVENSDDDFLSEVFQADENPYATINSLKSKENESNETTNNGTKSIDSTDITTHNLPESKTDFQTNVDDLYAKISKRSRSTEPLKGEDYNIHVKARIRSQIDPEYETLEDVQEKAGIFQKSPVGSVQDEDLDPDYQCLDDVKLQISDETVNLKTQAKEEEDIHSFTVNVYNEPDDKSLSDADSDSGEYEKLIPKSELEAAGPRANSEGDAKDIVSNNQLLNTETVDDPECIYDNPKILLRKQMNRRTPPFSCYSSRRSLTLSEPPSLKTPAEEELVERLSMLLAPPLPLRNYVRDDLGSRSTSTRHSWASTSSRNYEFLARSKSNSRDNLEKSQLNNDTLMSKSYSRENLENILGNHSNKAGSRSISTSKENIQISVREDKKLENNSEKIENCEVEFHDNCIENSDKLINENFTLLQRDEINSYSDIDTYQYNGSLNRLVDKNKFELEFNTTENELSPKVSYKSISDCQSLMHENITHKTSNNCKTGAQNKNCSESIPVGEKHIEPSVKEESQTVLNYHGGARPKIRSLNLQNSDIDKKKKTIIDLEKQKSKDLSCEKTENCEKLDKNKLCLSDTDLCKDNCSRLSEERGITNIDSVFTELTSFHNDNGYENEVIKELLPPWKRPYRFDYKTVYDDDVLEEIDCNFHSKTESESRIIPIQRIERKPLLYSNPRFLENFINGFFRTKMSLDPYYLLDGVFRCSRKFNLSPSDDFYFQTKCKHFFNYVRNMLIIENSEDFSHRDQLQKLSDLRQRRLEDTIKQFEFLPTFEEISSRLLGSKRYLDPWEPDDVQKRMTNILWEESIRVDVIERQQRWRENKASDKTRDQIYETESSGGSTESFRQDTSDTHSPSTPNEILENFLELCENGLGINLDYQSEDSDSEDELLTIDTYSRVVSRGHSNTNPNMSFLNNVSFNRALSGELSYMTRKRKSRKREKSLIIPSLDSGCLGSKCHLSWNSWNEIDSLFQKLVPYISPRLDFQFLLRTYAEFKFFILKDRRRNLDLRGCFRTYNPSLNIFYCCRFEEFVFLKLLRDEITHFSLVIQTASVSATLFVEEKDISFSLYQLIKIVLENIRKMKKFLPKEDVCDESETEIRTIETETESQATHIDSYHSKQNTQETVNRLECNPSRSNDDCLKSPESVFSSESDRVDSEQLVENPSPPPLSPPSWMSTPSTPELFVNDQSPSHTHTTGRYDATNDDESNQIYKPIRFRHAQKPWIPRRSRCYQYVPEFTSPVEKFHVSNHASFRSETLSSTLSGWMRPIDYLNDPNILDLEQIKQADSICHTSNSQCDPLPLHERDDFLESMQQLQLKEWYWGPISYEQAALILKDKEDGSFLVRDSSDRKYLLSLSFKSLGEVHHTRIEHAKGLFSFWSQPESHGKARICEFIDRSVQNSRDGRFLYFLRPSARGTPPLPIRLLCPVSRQFRVSSLKHLSRFVIRQTVRKDHICYLPLPHTVKGYLLDKQYYVEILADDQWAFDGDCPA